MVYNFISDNWIEFRMRLIELPLYFFLLGIGTCNLITKFFLKKAFS